MKKVKAQELVEFLVVAPFFIIIFGIMTEYAFAMHSRYLLTNGLKTSVGNIYSNIQADTTTEKTLGQIKTDLNEYLESNNASLSEVSVNIAAQGNYVSSIKASAVYKCAFTLPLFIGNILPKSFNFETLTMVPSAFLKDSGYTNLSEATPEKKSPEDRRYSPIASITDLPSNVGIIIKCENPSETELVNTLFSRNNSAGSELTNQTQLNGFDQIFIATNFEEMNDENLLKILAQYDKDSPAGNFDNLGVNYNTTIGYDETLTTEYKNSQLITYNEPITIDGVQYP